VASTWQEPQPDVSVAWLPDGSGAALGVGDCWSLLSVARLERLRDALTALLNLRPRQAAEPTREDEGCPPTR
jgi:hypothetical protein